MNPKSAAALAWFAAIVAFVSLVVMSPSAQFMLACVAARLALVPAVFARKGRRIAAWVVLTLSAVLAVLSFPNHQAAIEKYQDQARGGSAVTREAPARQK